LYIEHKQCILTENVLVTSGIGADFFRGNNDSSGKVSFRKEFPFDIL